MEAQDLQRIARRRAKAKMGVYIHALVYVCVVGSGAAAQQLLAPGFAGISVLPALGWGLGLAIHAGVVLFSGPLRERLEAEELAKLHARQR